jgi:hypothetical protein
VRISRAFRANLHHHHQPLQIMDSTMVEEILRLLTELVRTSGLRSPSSSPCSSHRHRHPCWFMQTSWIWPPVSPIPIRHSLHSPLNPLCGRRQWLQTTMRSARSRTAPLMSSSRSATSSSTWTRGRSKLCSTRASRSATMVIFPSLPPSSGP